MAFRDSLSVGSRVRATVEKHLAEEDPVKLAECEAEKAKNEAKEKAEAARFAAEMERRSKLPRPKIGMTTAQVRDKTSWGAGEITRMETAKQVKERWTYGDGRYLHFTNGVVTAIQD